MSVLDENGYDIRFPSSHVTVAKNMHVLVRGENIHGMYCVFNFLKVFPFMFWSLIALTLTFGT